MVEWEGTVLRVDSFDEDAEYMRNEGNFRFDDIEDKFEQLDDREDDQLHKTGLYAA